MLFVSLCGRQSDFSNFQNEGRRLPIGSVEKANFGVGQSKEDTERDGEGASRQCSHIQWFFFPYSHIRNATADDG